MPVTSGHPGRLLVRCASPGWRVANPPLRYYPHIKCVRPLARLAPLALTRPTRPSRPCARTTGQRRSGQDAARLRRGQRVVSGAARRADVPQLAGEPEETVRLRAGHRHQRPAAGPAGLRQCQRDLGAPQCPDGPHRAVVVRLRDDPVQRAHERDHESRAGPHRDDGPGGRPRPVLPAPVRRQGHAHRRAARVGALFLPDHAPSGRAALVPRRQRRVRRYVAGRRHRPRAGRLRRDGVPRDGERRRAVLRSARAGLRGDEDRFPAADQLVPVRHTLPHLAGADVFARTGAGLDGAQTGQPRLLFRAVPPRVRAVDGKCLGRLDRRREGVPAEEPRRHPAVPDHAAQGPDDPRAGLGVARLLRSDTRSHLRRLQLSWRGRARRRARREDRRGRADREAQRPDDLHRGVTGLRPARRHPLLHHRQRRLPRPGPPGSAKRQDDAVAEGRAHRRAGVQHGRSNLVGHQAPQRLVHHRADAGPVYRVDQGGDVSVRHRRLRPGPLARRDQGRCGVWRDRRQDGRPRVLARRRC